MLLKQAIDALGGSSPTQAAVRAACVALLMSGACRVLNSLAKEAQGPLFTPVSQVRFKESKWRMQFLCS